MKRMLIGICASFALLAGAGVVPAAGQEYRFTILTQTGIDNTFWQTIKRGMDDACETYQVDCQLLFTQENGNLQMHLQKSGNHDRSGCGWHRHGDCRGQSL